MLFWFYAEFARKSTIFQANARKPEIGILIITDFRLDEFFLKCKKSITDKTAAFRHR